MDILVESTKGFERDLDKLSYNDRDIVIRTINDCANLFQMQEANGYQKLYRLPIHLDLDGYESSLYVLRVSKSLRAILAVDEDPLFEQIIFTLFRVVEHDDLEKAYSSVAESLYQELLHSNRETAQIL